MWNTPSFPRTSEGKFGHVLQLKARSYCTLNAHSIRFNAHWFAFTLSRRECALSQSGLKPVWLNPLREVVLIWFKVDWPLEVDWSCDCTHVACQ